MVMLVMTFLMMMAVMAVMAVMRSYVSAVGWTIDPYTTTVAANIAP